MHLGQSTYCGKAEIKNWIIKNVPYNGTILDVGAGRGTYSDLLSDNKYLIDAVECYAPAASYIKDKYQNVYNVDICHFEYKREYDLIIFGDILEHLSIEDAQKSLRQAILHSKLVLVAVPFEYEQGAIDGNLAEEHIQTDLNEEIIKDRYPELKLILYCEDKNFKWNHGKPLRYAYYYAHRDVVGGEEIIKNFILTMQRTTDGFDYTKNMVLLTFDDGYYMQAINLMMSIQAYNPNVQFVCLCTPLSPSVVSKLFDKNNHLELLLYEYHTELTWNIKRWPITTIFRIFAPWLIDNRIKEVIYLDSDMLVKGSLDPLFNKKDYFLIMANEISGSSESREDKTGMNIYCNGGMSKINLEAFRQEYNIETYQKAFLDNLPFLKWLDQDFFNFYLGNDKLTKINGLIYNFQIYELIGCKHYNQILQNSRILHFSWQHPWDASCKFPELFDIYLQYSFYKPIMERVLDAQRKNSNHKRVSVLIPVYNTEKYIERCINSIPNRPDIEIIVVDDCSTDRSLELAVKALNRKTLAMCKIYKNNQNMGIGCVRNILLDLATGDYVFFLDSDDYIFGEAFSNIIENILKNQICVKGLCTNPFGEVFPYEVHRGDFLLRSFIGDTRHPTIRCHEDSFFKDALWQKPGYCEIQINEVLYYYFEPRIDSLTWTNKKDRGFDEYQKDEEYWVEKRKPEWFKKHKKTTR